MSAIVQGSTIGILGGGQLGRMTAMAARSLGYRVQVMDPDPSCPARFVVDACFVGNWDDAAVRKTAERAYWDALDARAHIAALSAEYWLGTVFLESVGLNVPEEYITLWATYRYTTLDVLRLSLTCMMIFFKSDHPPQFLLQIQPDLAERPPSPSPDANSAADSLSSS